MVSLWILHATSFERKRWMFWTIDLSFYVTNIVSDWSAYNKQRAYNACKDIEFQISESGPVLGRLTVSWSRIRFSRVSQP